MAVIRVTVPPQHTPAQEQRLVAEVAASYAESTGSHGVTPEATWSEEVDVRSLQAATTSRWAS